MTNFELTPTTQHVVCSICDIGCQLRAETVDRRLLRILPHEKPILAKNICYKGTAAPAPAAPAMSTSPPAGSVCRC